MESVAKLNLSASGAPEPGLGKNRRKTSLLSEPQSLLGCEGWKEAWLSFPAEVLNKEQAGLRIAQGAFLACSSLPTALRSLSSVAWSEVLRM